MSRRAKGWSFISAAYLLLSSRKICTFVYICVCVCLSISVDRYSYVNKSCILGHNWTNTYRLVTLKLMEVRVKGEASQDILCVNSVGILSMVIMNCILTCLQSITPVIYAKGNANLYYEFLLLRVCNLNDFIDFNIQYRSQPGQYEYYKNYDDLEVTSTTFITAQVKLWLHLFWFYMFMQQIHFRRDHFLCEDDSCLAKKFTVFQNESELKVNTFKEFLLYLFF